MSPSPIASTEAGSSQCCSADRQPTDSTSCCQNTSAPSESAGCCSKPAPNSPPKEKVPKKRFGGRSALAAKEGSKDGALTPHAPRPRRTLNAIPASILEDPEIIAAHSLLPPTYNFELPKTIHFLRQNKIERVALQLPEGLLIFACTLSDILQKFVPGLETVIMGDVTYGACCVDDFTARALGCGALIHYAHSCLIPQDQLGGEVKVLYVFVGMEVDVRHLIATIEKNLGQEKQKPKLALVGTIQFNAGLAQTRTELLGRGWEVDVPQAMPLSKGEVLGCTAPRLAGDIDALLYIGDGRFHLESAMIMNPGVPAYRYDPYSRKFTREEYAHAEMKGLRKDAVETARKAKKWGLVLGTLGRQGNIATLERIEKLLEKRGTPYVILLLSEIFPGKLAMMEEVEAWVQVACPRLSIDWGYAFPRPLLSPYEAMVSLGERQMWEEVYPMDFYSKEGLGRTRRPKLEIEAAAT